MEEAAAELKKGTAAVDALWDEVPKLNKVMSDAGVAYFRVDLQAVPAAAAGGRGGGNYEPRPQGSGGPLEVCLRALGCAGGVAQVGFKRRDLSGVAGDGEDRLQQESSARGVLEIAGKRRRAVDADSPRRDGVALRVEEREGHGSGGASVVEAGDVHLNGACAASGLRRCHAHIRR